MARERSVTVGPSSLSRGPARAGTRARRVASVAIATVLLAACSADDGDSGSQTMVPTTSEPATTSPVDGAAQGFTTSRFAVPFAASPPAWIADEPSEEEETFLTWDDGLIAIRVLAPVELFPSATAPAQPLPDDYIAYLLAETDHGVVFEDVLRTHIDGHPAILLTATTPRSMDGDIGCAVEGTDAAECFGFQPDLRLRMAAVDVDGRWVVAWLRTFVDDDVDLEEADARFDEFAESLDFSG